MRIISFALLLMLCAAAASAAAFADLRGVVRDPNQRPIKGAVVTISARTLSFVKTEQTNDSGEFLFRAIPSGEYTISVEYSGFNKAERSVQIATCDAPKLEFNLTVSPVSQQISVNETASRTDTNMPTPITM